MILKIIKYAVAVLVCLTALTLPYKPRIIFNDILAFVAHLPYVLFGRLMNFFLKNLNLSADEVYEKQ